MKSAATHEFLTPKYECANGPANSSLAFEAHLRNFAPILSVCKDAPIRPATRSLIVLAPHKALKVNSHTYMGILTNYRPDTGNGPPCSNHRSKILRLDSKHKLGAKYKKLSEHTDRV